MILDPNPYVLTIQVELTRELTDEARKAATELLAKDIEHEFKSNDWGWGIARIEGVYPAIPSCSHQT